MKQKIFLSLALLLPCFAHAKLKTDGEAGIVSTTGNTRNKSYSVKDKTQLQIEDDNYIFNGTYLEAQKEDDITAQNWLLGLRYERLLKGDLSGFFSQQAEGDKFAGILQRYNTDIGGKQYLIKRDKDLNLIAEAGYRYTHEHNSNNQYGNFQKARLYLEFEKFLNPTVSTKLFVEYLPNFTEGSNWLLNSEASLSAALNSVFALKVAYMVRYNHAPPKSTAEKTDTTLTTALTAKL